MLNNESNKPNLGSYDHILVAFSGGKDSIACFLTLLENGVDLSKVELWHHEIDGREGSNLMDWDVTPAYCNAFANAFGVPLYFSWLEGGFEREMLRNNTPKARTFWQNPDGSLGVSGGKGPCNTRMKFPQVSADLSVRWCSAYLKIDVMKAAIAGQARFNGKRVLVITGERAAESPGRARYAEFEPHRTSNDRRHVDQWRPVHKLSTAQVWDLIAKYRVNPHPAYRAGFGRVSCQFCIFGSPDQCASARALSPERYAKVTAYEKQFGKTIQRKEDFNTRADRGTAYAFTPEDAAACNSKTFREPIILEQWTMPRGAFAESCGPV